MKRCIPMASSLCLLVGLFSSHNIITTAFEIIQCHYFDSSATCSGSNRTNYAQQFYEACSVQLCGGQLVNASTVGRCRGDTFLRVYSAEGHEIAVNDNAVGGDGEALCSEVSFSMPHAYRCEDYTFHLGCAGNHDHCAGQLWINVSGV